MTYYRTNTNALTTEDWVRTTKDMRISAYGPATSVGTTTSPKSRSLKETDDVEEGFVPAAPRAGEISGYVPRRRRAVHAKKRF
jgi:hypothetical protein